MPGDTVVFGYDAAGNQARADNRHARVRRSYARNGAVLTDTLRIRTVRHETEQHTEADPNGFQTHAYVLRSQYDATGRLTGLTYPTQLCTNCSASYTYDDATTGALKRLTDPWANVIDFWYGAAGTLDSAGYPGSVRERVTYDAEGRVTLRSVTLTGGYRVIDDSLGYDPVGRIAGGHTYAARARRLRALMNVYSGLGTLAGTEQRFKDDGADPKGEAFRNDALGNRTYSEKRNFSFSYENNPARRQSTYDDATGRLVETYAVTESGARDELGYWESSGYTYSMPGHLRFKGYVRVPHVEGEAPQWWQEASYYQADGKLAVFERHDGQGTMEAAGGPLTGKGLREEYRYDALGRRVLVWARRGAGCTDSNTGCESTVRRAIWAGEQLVYETRGKGADSVLSSALENEAPSGDGERGQPKAYGEVGYAHAGGIDHPLVVHRASTGTTFFPHTNWRGLYDGATNPAGQLIPCYGSNPAPCANVPDIDWPGSETSVFIGATPTSRVNPAEWAGSLVTEQADASGLLYRRNRYYDPASGRFTQPDPIGLAGGAERVRIRERGPGQLLRSVWSH